MHAFEPQGLTGRLGALCVPFVPHCGFGTRAGVEDAVPFRISQAFGVSGCFSVFRGCREGAAGADPFFDFYVQVWEIKGLFFDPFASVGNK